MVENTKPDETSAGAGSCPRAHLGRGVDETLRAAAGAGSCPGVALDPGVDETLLVVWDVEAGIVDGIEENLEQFEVYMKKVEKVKEYDEEFPAGIVGALETAACSRFRAAAQKRAGLTPAFPGSRSGWCPPADDGSLAETPDVGNTANRLAPRKKVTRWTKANVGQSIHDAISVRNSFRALETCDDKGIVKVRGKTATPTPMTSDFSAKVDKVTPAAPAPRHVSTPATALRHAPNKHRFACEHPAAKKPMAEHVPMQDEELMKMVEDKKAKVQHAMSMLAEIRSGGDLCSMPELHGKWEKLTAVMDSGAFVPVIPPTVGKEYKTQESAASKAGVAYKAANGGEIANVGEKSMPVVTAEGTMRGYCSQVAGVTQALQSVRHLNSTGHLVVFDGQDSFMVNKVSGEVNWIEDDGSNFTMTMWIVLPGEVNAVVEQLDFHGQAPYPKRW